MRNARKRNTVIGAMVGLWLILVYERQGEFRRWRTSVEYGNVRTLSRAAAVVRNGYLPSREIHTAVGPVEVRVPKVRDRSGTGVKFNSALVPPYVRRSKTIATALPWLYLKGVSTGDMREALAVLVGEMPRASRRTWSVGSRRSGPPRMWNRMKRDRTPEGKKELTK